MGKVFVVMETDEFGEFPIRAFSNMDDAESFAIDKDMKEEARRLRRNKCMECTLPCSQEDCYTEPTYLDEPCGNYESYEENKYYRIEEVELD